MLVEFILDICMIILRMTCKNEIGYYDLCLNLQIIEPKGNFAVPSCIGGITIDEGGSNLSFENPLDDVNIIDFQGIRHFILQTLEFLFRSKKWESLVHIAMQFNTITQ